MKTRYYATLAVLLFVIYLAWFVCQVPTLSCKTALAGAVLAGAVVGFFNGRIAKKEGAGQW